MGRRNVRANVDVDVDVSLAEIDTGDLIDETVDRLSAGEAFPACEKAAVQLLTELGYELSKPRPLELSTAARLRPEEYGAWLARARLAGDVAPPRRGAA